MPDILISLGNALGDISIGVLLGGGQATISSTEKESSPASPPSAPTSERLPQPIARPLADVFSEAAVTSSSGMPRDIQSATYLRPAPSVHSPSTPVRGSFATVDRAGAAAVTAAVGVVSRAQPVPLDSSAPAPVLHRPAPKAAPPAPAQPQQPQPAARTRPAPAPASAPAPAAGAPLALPDISVDSAFGVLLAHAAAADRDAAAASAKAARGHDVGAWPLRRASGVDPSVLLYGSRIMVRSCAPHAGTLLSSLPSQPRSPASPASVEEEGDDDGVGPVRPSGMGVAHDGEVWRLLPAHAPLSAVAGTPVRNGDAIALQCVATGLFLSAAPFAPHGPAYALPDDASPDARPVLSLPPPSLDSGLPAPHQQWMLVAPEALASSVVPPSSSKSAQLQQQQALLASAPLLSSMQRFALLPLGLSQGATSSAGGEGVASLRRLQALQVGDAVTRRSYTQHDGRASGSAMRQVALIDSLAAAQLVAGAGGGRGTLPPLEEAARTGAALLAAAPPLAALWCAAAVPGPSAAAQSSAPSAWAPHWSVSRPYLTAAFLLAPQPAAADDGRAPLHTCLARLPAARQEGVLVRHLLDALSGTPGELFTIEAPLVREPGASPYSGSPLAAPLAIEGDGSSSSGGVRFVLSPSASAPGSGLDPSLAQLAGRMLPLASHFARCSAHVERRSRPGGGRVSQALAAAARLVLREYSALLVRLETLAAKTPLFPAAGAGGGAAAGPAPPPPPPSLSLQQLWFYLQPSLRTLAALDALLHSAATATGGALLSALSASLSRSGDDSARALGGFLLERAAAPYLRALQRWLYAGELDDPHAEFLVVDSEAEGGPATGDGGDGWRTRFTLASQPGAIPPFLAPHAADILAAGRYVHALRLCCSPPPPPLRGSQLPSAQRATAGPDRHAPPPPLVPVCAHAAPIPFSASASAYGPAVQRALAWSSTALLEVIMTGGGAQTAAASGGTAGAASPAPSLAASQLPRPSPHVGTGLLRVLGTLKAFLLTAQGDFLSQFLETADEELGRPLVPTPAPDGSGGVVRPVSLQRLRGLLELSLRSCGGGGAGDVDPSVRACRLSASLAPVSLMAQLDILAAERAVHEATARGDGPSANAAAATLSSLRRRPPSTGLKGYNVFQLEVTAPWPLALALPAGTLGKYQLLFRHLFFTRYVERTVGGAWGAQQSCKELDLRATLALSHGLRHRMLHFLTNLNLYMTSEVIEPRWHAAAASLGSCASLDEALAAHEDFLDACMRDCLLRSPELLRLLTKLTTLCLLFAQQLTGAIESHRLTDEQLDAAAGLSKASRRAAQQRERGDYYSGDEGGDGEDGDRRGSASRGSRRGSPQQKAPSGASADRARRAARTRVQTEAMRRTMAQRGWQGMIAKSGAMFDSLLREFLLRVTSSSSPSSTSSGIGSGGAGDSDRGLGSHLAHLVARLDFNGFYTRAHSGHGGGAAAAAGGPGGFSFHGAHDGGGESS